MNKAIHFGLYGRVMRNNELLQVQEVTDSNCTQNSGNLSRFSHLEEQNFVAVIVVRD